MSPAKVKLRQVRIEKPNTFSTAVANQKQVGP